MIYYIYILENQINNKIYVGQTNNILKRRREHKSRKNKTPLYCAIQKYGFDNFKMFIIEKFDNISDVDNAEEFWIKFLQTQNRDIGYNLATGGKVNRGFKHSDKFKKEQSERKKIYYITNKPHNYGKTTSEDIKNNLSNMWAGEKSLNDEFTNKQVKEIRELYSTNKYSQTKLAEIYQTSTFTISEIVRYKRYKLI